MHHVRMTNSDEASVVHLLSDDPQRFHNRFPSKKDPAGFRQEWKDRFKRGRVLLCLGNRKSDAIDCFGPRRDVAKFNQYLGRDVQNLLAAVQFNDRNERQ